MGPIDQLPNADVNDASRSKSDAVQHTRTMHLDSPDADPKIVSDHFAGNAVHHRIEHLTLAVAERENSIDCL